MNLNHFYHYYKSKSGGVSNLLKATEDFDSSIDWNKLPSTDAPTISGGITDPNGGSDAQRINFTDNRQARVQQRVSLSASTQYTFSVYARVNTGTEQFRLRNVTLGEAEAKTATTSWTRFEYTFTTTTGGNYDLSIQNSSNDARTVEFWGAMLNVGASANDYVKVDPSISGSTPTPAYSGFGDTYGDVTAYYSLRKFTEAETLNAIRVRRSSDDTEQDIGFDANGDLDTTALTTFVNADVDVYTSDFSSSIDGWSDNNMSTAVNQTIGGTSGWLEAESEVDSTLLKRLKAPISLQEGCDYTVVSKVYVESGNNVGGLYIGADGNGLLVSTTTTDEVVELEVTFTANQDGDLEWFMTDAILDATFSGGLGKSIYVKDTIITQTTADGAVTTFYDQSGNGNNATNSTESEQPLVVSGGTLVTENGKAAIEFDGVDDMLQKDIDPDIAQPLTLFHVRRYRSNGTYCAIGYDNTTGSGYADINIFGDFRSYYGGGYTGVITDNTDQGLFFSLANGTGSAVGLDGAALDTTNAQGTQGLEVLTIGSVVGAFDAPINTQEIIIFDSDQSTNRSGIEGNINNHFSIYP